MPLWFVEHDRRLKVANAEALPPLPAEVEALSRKGTAVITCRSGSKPPDKVLKRFNGLNRFPDLQAESLHFHAIESDSPLAPLWLWDIAHSCALGSMLAFSGDEPDKAWLRRRYFAQGLEVVSEEGDSLVFRKVAPLPAERDAGLDAWSFCIPVGPGDPTVLNATVGRILQLRVPEFEIILCGVPGDGFRYGNRVRIIGKDLPATPLIPGLKKNMLAEAASHENLCILHDRVFLSRAFMRAIRAFGDLYPMTAFQSLYFDDRLNLDYRRYSDLNKIVVPRSDLPTGVIDSGDAISAFSPATRAAFEGSGFIYCNALRHDRDQQYTCGSLYLCKRAVWLSEPQSNTIEWGAFEDVEHGLRAGEAGIPCRINPYTMTQSVNSRTVLAYAGYVSVEDAGGQRRERRAPLCFLPLPRKPLLRVSPAAVSEKLQTFLARHCNEHPTNPKWSRFTRRTTGRKRYKAIANALKYARYPINEHACRELIRDYEKLLFVDQLPYGQAEHLLYEFRHNGPNGFGAMIYTPSLVGQVAQRPGKGVFAASPSSFFPRKGLGLLIGSVVTAMLIAGSRYPPIVHAGGFWRLLRDIFDTTPTDKPKPDAARE